MCLKKLSPLLLLFLVFLLSLPRLCLADEVYEITEAELTELETILSRQSETIEMQKNELNELSIELDGLSNTISQQQTTISELETYLQQSESEAMAQQIRTGAISFGAGVIVSIVVSFFIQ